MEDILIQDDGIIIPFNIQYSRETKFTFIAKTRDATDEAEAADGDVDFGTTLGMGEFNLHGIIEFETLTDRNSFELELTEQFNECRTAQKISYEHTPSRYTHIRLSNYEITRFTHHLEIRAQFKSDPYWYSSEEYSFAGNGTVANNGTFETPLIFEIEGLVTDPVVTVGSNTFSFTGSLGYGQVLTIDTGNGTAKLDGNDVQASFAENLILFVQPGNTVVTAAAGGTTTVRWRDRTL